jgi:hypothetical protein
MKNPFRHWHLVMSTKKPPVTDYPLADRYRFRLTRTLYLLNGLVFVIGVIILYQTPNPQEPIEEIFHEVGMAFVIAVTITTIYEGYVRGRLTAETMEGALRIIMNDFIEPATWREVRDQILDKIAIRRHMVVEVRVRKLPGDLHNHYLLWTSMAYSLENLRSHPKNVRVYHALDRYMHESQSSLPRFTSIKIDDVSGKIPHDAAPFDQHVDLAPRGTPGRDIVIQREELISVPGAYILVMSELTDFTRLEVSELPEGLKMQLSCFPDPDVNFSHAGRVVSIDRRLLPGQCVELRFFPNDR